MTLEVLFAQAHQGRTFLLMLLCGAAMGLLVHLATYLHRISALWGSAADLLLASGLALTLGWVLLQSGEGLRLYGLLGLCVGGALYVGGLSFAVSWLMNRLTRRQKPPRTPP
ncbi:MAG: hypothetical protein PUC00_00035 [Clostridiales bacterium]|nr:hypothetical protein [Clostridiales bacterium]